MPEDIIIRFLVGGVIVSFFSMLGDLFRPKSFAGLFGAAPSVALATLALTISKQGGAYAAVEGRSMIAGAVALFIYSALVSSLMMRYRLPALMVTLVSILLWGAIAVGLWFLLLR